MHPDMVKIKKNPHGGTVPAIVLLAILMFGSLGCGFVGQRTRKVEKLPDAAPPPAKPTFELLPFGNPSNAGTADRDNWLLTHYSHVLSYNNSRGTLNWAAWRTTREDMGESLARPDFEPDPTLDEGMVRVSYSDYSGSGYDRGHIVPSADRFGNAELNRQTFYMTNIVPQTGDLNQYPWNKLEMYARTLVYRGNTLYTIAGAYGDKGRLRGKVTVPTNCWKVIVVFPRGAAADKIDSNTRIIAVDMPNIDGIEDVDWDRYKTTVRDIEKRTGLDLFSALPKEVQDTVETRQEPNKLRSP